MALCVGRKKTGQPCKKAAIRGATVCAHHGGSAPQVRRKAAIVATVQNYGLADANIDPNTTLLRLISATANLLYDVSADLETAYTAADDGIEWAGYSPRVRALIGPTYASDGDGGRVETGEAIRGLITLHGQLQDRLARFCKLAIDAGLSERMVRIAEKQAEIMFEVLRGGLIDFGMDEGQIAEVLPHVARRLRAIS